MAALQVKIKVGEILDRNGDKNHMPCHGITAAFAVFYTTNQRYDEYCFSASEEEAEREGHHVRDYVTTVGSTSCQYPR